MADIQPEINAFKSAVYGEDVRDAMVSLANKLHTETKSSKILETFHIHMTDIQIEKGNSTDGAYFKFSDSYVRGYTEDGTGSIRFKWENFLPESHVPELSPGGTFTDYINLPHNYMIVFDLDDLTYKMLSYTSLPPSPVIVFYESFGDIRGGLVMDPWSRDEFGRVDKWSRDEFGRVDKILDSISEPYKNINTSEIGPYYYSRTESNPGDLRTGDNYIGTKDLVKVKPNTKYSISFVDGPTESSIFYCFYDASKKAYYPDCTTILTGKVTGGTVESTDYAEYIRVFTYGANFSTLYPDCKIQIEEGDVVTPYSNPYTAVDSHARYLSENLAEYLAEKKDTVPDYWKDTLVEKCNLINQLKVLIGPTGDAFVFVTDTHWRNNAMNSPRLIDYILRNTGVDMVVNGGDNLQAHLDTLSGAYDEVLASVKAFWYPGRRIFGVYGNHDNNTNNNAGYPERYLNRDAIYSAIYAQYARNDLVYSPNQNSYSYYWDSVLNKIRYVFLDWGGNTSTNTAFIDSTFDTIPEGYSAVVICHGFYSVTNVLDDTTVIERKYLLDACEPYADKIFFFLQGHAHTDALRYTSYGVPIIITRNDSLAGSGVDAKTAGTITEQAFDVVIFDPIKKLLNLVRIGLGEDRVVEFE